LANYYVDTSSLVKRYVVERGTPWVISWVEPAANNIIFVCEITPIEVASSFERRIRDGSLSSTAAGLLFNDFLIHLEQEYLVYALGTPAFMLARSLVQKHPLRTLDAIQLASAIELRAFFSEPITFVSGDRNLLAAASLEGFPIDDPNLHP